MLFFLILQLRVHGDDSMPVFHSGCSLNVHQASPENQRSVAWTGWEHLSNLKPMYFCAPDESLPVHSEVFFTSSGAQGSGKHSGGSGLLGDFEHKGLCEWPRSWAKREVKSRALCHCPHQSVPMESTAGIMQPLSEAHSLTQNLRGLDVLTQTSPQPIYIPA